MNKLKNGFTTLELLLCLIIITIIGFTGYHVWHSRQQTDNLLNSAQNEQVAVKSSTSIKTFADCQKAAGSKVETSYPEVCITKTGQRFTQPTTTQYLTIKEWGVKMPDRDNEQFYYTFADTQTEGTQSDITVYSKVADALTGPAGVSCKGEYVAYLLRLPKDDPKWQPAQNVNDGNVSPLFSVRKTIGDYQYAIATKKQYGPQCFEVTTTGDYNVDPTTSQKFDDIVNSLSTDFKNISAN